MSTQPPLASALIVLFLTVAALAYLLPTLVAVCRGSVATTYVVILNVALGWTGAGWICAFVMALGPRTPRPPVQAPTRPLPRPASPAEAAGIYLDGVYLASTGHDTHTWVIREAGRWRVVYEVAGQERLVGAVAEADVPLSVLATALVPSEVER